MAEKTLAMRVLEGQKITYRVHQYNRDIRDAELVARQVGLDASRVFKTLVVTGSTGKPLLVMIPADRQLDLKKMARAAGEKKVRMAGHREAEQLTGLQVGGISALELLNRGFANYIDESAKQYDSICISAGKRGLQLEIPVNDLIRLTGARIIAVTS